MKSTPDLLSTDFIDISAFDKNEKTVPSEEKPLPPQKPESEKKAAVKKAAEKVGTPPVYGKKAQPAKEKERVVNNSLPANQPSTPANNKKIMTIKIRKSPSQKKKMSLWKWK